MFVVLPALCRNLRLVLPVVLLGGCDYFSAPAAEQSAQVMTSEVVEGTISDDMLPLGDMRSQAPRAAVQAEAGATGTGQANGASSGAPQPAAGEAADPAPAAAEPVVAAEPAAPAP